MSFNIYPLVCLGYNNAINYLQNRWLRKNKIDDLRDISIYHEKTEYKTFSDNFEFYFSRVFNVQFCS